MNYTTNRRLETELTAVARKRGYNGSLFLRYTPPLSDLGQEMLAIDLSLAIRPRPETKRQRDLVREWARNVVLSSTEPERPTAKPAKRRTVKW
jgi:hypothetical protein